MKIKTIALAVILAVNAPTTISKEYTKQEALNAEVLGGQTFKQLENQYIVLFKASANTQTIKKLQATLSQSHNGPILKAFTKLNGFSGYLSKQQLKALKNHPDISSIEPNIAFSSALNHKALNTKSTVSVPWGLDRIDQPQLPLNNQFTPYGDGSGVHAYIIDSGINITHNEFGNRAVWDFTASNITDGNQDGAGSGTHLAGIVGGSAHGIAKNVSLHAIKVTNNQNQGTLAGLIEGIDYVANNHISPAVAVVGVSMPHSTALNQAIANASAAGVSISVPSGDQDKNACNYSPASASNNNNGVLSVAASTAQDSASPYSNAGSCVDIYAPGLFIQSAWNSSNIANNTISHSPTAAAHTAGVAAIIRSYDDSCSNIQVKDKLLNFSYTNQLQNVPSGTANRLLAVPTQVDTTDCNGSPTVPGDIVLHNTFTPGCGLNDLTWRAPTGPVFYYELYLNDSLHSSGVASHIDYKATVYASVPTQAKVRACSRTACGAFSNIVDLEAHPDPNSCAQ